MPPSRREGGLKCSRIWERVALVVWDDGLSEQSLGVVCM